MSDDLYGSNESEDMSSFLQILLHNSSSSTTDSAVASAAAGGLFAGAGVPAGVAESSSSINFSDPSSYLAKESNGINPSFRLRNLGNLGSSSEGYEASEIPVSPGPQRGSKRSRAAEFHNLSEKRRRSRINEKLKALQNLIPNSNKTDKASMLDDAIEYLKQLQLQVQMLTMRNGSSIHPGYSLGSLRSMFGQTGLEFDGENVLPNANRGPDIPYRDGVFFMQNARESTIHPSATQPISAPTMTNNIHSRNLPTSVPMMQNHYGLLNHLASSKDMSRDDTLSRLQLDISCSGNNSSSGMST